MFESIINFFKNIRKKEQETVKSKDAAKERLHLVLMQDRANVSADFLDLMKQEIIEVIKKYIDVDENAIDVRLTNKANGDGTTGAPALYANIPIVSIKEEVRNKIARENDAKAEHIVPDKKEEKTEEPEESEKQKVNTTDTDVSNTTIEENIEEKNDEMKENTVNSQEKSEEDSVKTNKETLNETENTTNTRRRVSRRK